MPGAKPSMFLIQDVLMINVWAGIVSRTQMIWVFVSLAAHSQPSSSSSSSSCRLLFPQESTSKRLYQDLVSASGLSATFRNRFPAIFQNEW